MDWDQAVDWLERGCALAYPTDTLWGLGCRADDPAAVSRCLAIKGPSRQTTSSMIVPLEWLHEIVVMPSEAEVDRFLPGPYTLVLPLRQMRFKHLADPKLSTIGIRVPNHLKLMAAVHKLGQPLLTTSLNQHGREPALNYEQAKALADVCGIGIVDEAFDGEGPSTVIRWHQDRWHVLRQGLGPAPD